MKGDTVICFDAGSDYGRAYVVRWDGTVCTQTHAVDLLEQEAQRRSANMSEANQLREREAGPGGLGLRLQRAVNSS